MLVIVEESFVDGKINGLARYFFSKYGRTEATYKNGIIHGFWRFYDHRGSLGEEIQFENGKRHGLSNGFYENGILGSEHEYRHGKADFTSHHYNQNGKRYMESDYVLGMTYFDKDGNKMPRGEEVFEKSDGAERGVLRTKIQMAMGKWVSTFE